MIWPLLIVAWFALSYGWLLWLEHKTKCEDKDEQAHLPDCPGTFTPEQIARFVEMKQQYAAGMLTDDDIDWQQIHGW